MIKLNSCPFCGGEAVERCFHEYDAIECEKCGQIVILPQHGTGEEHIFAWNRRVESDNPPLTLEQLKTMDGKPIWRFNCEKNTGGWEIVSLDDAGNLYFIVSFLVGGNDMNKMIIQNIMAGRERIYRYQYGPDMMDTYR